METQLISLSCDDHYLSLILENSETDVQENPQQPISDAKYAEELQLQEAIMASLSALQTPSNPPKGLEEEAGDSSEKTPGESSQNLCEICAEGKDNDQMLAVQNCGHQFCVECISKHVSIQFNKRTVLNTEKAPSLSCPGFDCKGVLQMDKCREIVPRDVASMWDDAICEAMIEPSQRFYCPYKDCSGLLENDSGEAITEAECPFCRRLMCVQCHVPWHPGLGCEEFSRLSESERGHEDLMMHELAKEKKWPRCPKCKFYVERNQGCLHMTCRCGFEFCYACGGTWSSTHGSCLT